jgi:hypothetical protein
MFANLLSGFCFYVLQSFANIVFYLEIEALDEEDAYLAQAAFDHMQLNDEVWVYAVFSSSVYFEKFSYLHNFCTSS